MAEERARLQAAAGKKAVVDKAAEIVKMKRKLETAEAEIMQYAKDIITGHIIIKVIAQLESYIWLESSLSQALRNLGGDGWLSHHAYLCIHHM